MLPSAVCRAPVGQVFVEAGVADGPVASPALACKSLTSAPPFIAVAARATGLSRTRRSKSSRPAWCCQGRYLRRLRRTSSRRSCRSGWLMSSGVRSQASLIPAPATREQRSVFGVGNACLFHNGNGGLWVSSSSLQFGADVQGSPGCGGSPVNSAEQPFIVERFAPPGRKKGQGRISASQIRLRRLLVTMRRRVKIWSGGQHAAPSLVPSSWPSLWAGSLSAAATITSKGPA